MVGGGERAPKMADRWTVEKTAHPWQPPPRSRTGRGRTPTDQETERFQQHFGSKLEAQQQSERSPEPDTHPVRRSGSQEELDLLLNRLAQLTKNLPDLGKKSERTRTLPSTRLATKEISSPVRDLPRYLPSCTGGEQEEVERRRVGEFSHILEEPEPYANIDVDRFMMNTRHITRSGSREAMGACQAGLESPGLLRKIMGVGENEGVTIERKSSPFLQNADDLFDDRERRKMSPLYSSTPKVSREEKASAYLFPRVTVPASSPLMDGHHFDDLEASLTWLERQQRKLQERRHTEMRNGNKDRSKVMNGYHRAQSETASRDGYSGGVLSSGLYPGVSGRESTSPHKTLPYNKPAVNIPVRVDPTYYQLQQQAQTYHTLNNASLASANTRDRYYYERQQQEYSPSYGGSSIGRRPTSLSRQKSDTSFDRSRPFINRRLAYDSESESELVTDLFGRKGGGNVYGSNSSIDSTTLQWGPAGVGGYYSHPGSRPITPAFPSAPSTPVFGGKSATLQHCGRAASPAGSLYNHHFLPGGRRGSISSAGGDPAEVPAASVRLVKDSYRLWYKPDVSREAAISALRHCQPGTFLVRDSNSFPGAFGLALKVSVAPSNSFNGRDAKDPGSELIRHFLIEPTPKGVRLKGYANEPVFASLSALVYQHTVTQLALPERLVLPQTDLLDDGLGTRGGPRGRRGSTDSAASQMQQLLSTGAACNVTYLLTMETDALTGPIAVRKATNQLLRGSRQPTPLLVHFKVSAQGITLTDSARRRFFRKHFSTAAISFCGADPADRRWTEPPKRPGVPADPSAGPGPTRRIFGFVARRRTGGGGGNQCHLFAEHDPEQPARAIVNFVNKVLLQQSKGARSDVV